MGAVRPVERAEMLRLENEAGELLTAGADPWRVLRALSSFDGSPRTRAAWLRCEGWLRVARREGPSAQAEAWLRQAFEAGLEDLRRYPNLYDQQAKAGEDELVWLSVAQPFAPWFEYLVMFGRFAEASDVRARAMQVLGPGLIAKQRPRIKALVENLASMATPEIFQRARWTDFLPYLARGADCEVSELDVQWALTPLANGGGMVETIYVGLPVPLFSGEPLWFAFSHFVGDANVRVFTLEWAAHSWSARPAAWARNDVYSPKTHGANTAPGAAPRPNLGAASPYLSAFMAFINDEMHKTPSSIPPMSLQASAAYLVNEMRAPIPTLAPRSYPPLAPSKATRTHPAVWIILAMVLAAGAAFGLWQLKRVAEERAKIRACTSLGMPESACRDFVRSDRAAH